MAFKAMLSKLIPLDVLPQPVEYDYVEFDSDGEPETFYTPLACALDEGKERVIFLQYWHPDFGDADPPIRTFDDIEVEVDDVGFARVPGDKVGFFFTVSRAAVLSDFPHLCTQGQGD